MALNNVTFFVFWWVLMQRVPALRGWRLADMQLLFGVVAAGFGLTVTLAGGVRHLGRLIEEGDARHAADAAAGRCCCYALGTPLAAVGLRRPALGPAVHRVRRARSPGARRRPSCWRVRRQRAGDLLACGIVFFSLAFWLGSVETVARQLWELLITFSLYPEPLFGGALRFALFTVLPAGFVGYLPARVIRSPSMPDMLMLVVGALLYLVFAIQVFQAGLRRYASGSRFTTFG